MSLKKRVAVRYNSRQIVPFNLVKDPPVPLPDTVKIFIGPANKPLLPDHYYDCETKKILIVPAEGPDGRLYNLEDILLTITPMLEYAVPETANKILSSYKTKPDLQNEMLNNPTAAEEIASLLTERGFDKYRDLQSNLDEYTADLNKRLEAAKEASKKTDSNDNTVCLVLLVLGLTIMLAAGLSILAVDEDSVNSTQNTNSSQEDIHSQFVPIYICAGIGAGFMVLSGILMGVQHNRENYV